MSSSAVRGGRPPCGCGRRAVAVLLQRAISHARRGDCGRSVGELERLYRECFEAPDGTRPAPAEVNEAAVAGGSA